MDASQHPIEPPYFEILTPTGVRIRTTPSYWAKIVTLKHPIIKGREEFVKLVLQEPIEVRRSRSDPMVYLYYKDEPPYFLCVVARHLNGEGFIITVYRTDKIKRGEPVWTP
ncbi:MAG: DUF4258 domain-containing protein [Symploca sp. SIO2E9]|nr:DUF4258 domain-containing protein [Symploca sp. SIO2E9]